MNTADAIRLAAEAAPETMSKVAAALRELDRSNSLFTEEVTRDFQKIAAAFGERVKTAGVFSDIKKAFPGVIANTAVGVGATMAGAAGIALASDLWSRAKRGLTKERNWKAIMAANPEIKTKFEHEPKKVRMAFDTLHRFAPDIAADPLAGGALLYNLSHSSEGTHIQHVRQAIDAQKAKNESGSNWLWGGRGPTQMGNSMPFSPSKGGSGSDSFGTRPLRGGAKG